MIAVKLYSQFFGVPVKVRVAIGNKRPRCNQLIVGPDSWAYQVLRHTFGERFMPLSQSTVFIDRSGHGVFNFARLDDLFTIGDRFDAAV
jgi:hypothetical protein